MPRNREPVNSERTYSRLKQRIVSGDLAPNTRLVEAQLASEMAVSRTPIRESLKRLMAEGLVSRDAAGGLVVHEASPREIEELYLVREVLDGLAARLAAHRISPDELAKLEVIMDTMTEAIDRGRVDDIVAANIAFHDLIYEVAGNVRLSEVAKGLRDFVQRFSPQAFASFSRASDVLSEHRTIVAALSERDPDMAESAARQHLYQARLYLTRRRLDEKIGATVA